ncbi:MAG: hypothetical protein KF906_10360 [Actinobacteria bacterium]|nr:hypothetical protein [Actinomycetota bacterium]
MTDLPVSDDNLPGRLGALARVVDGELIIDLEPTPEVLHLGCVRTSVLSYLVDCVTGIPLQRADAWTLTTDMTVRAAAVPAPELVVARHRVLRRGGRSATARVSLVDGDGAPMGDGAAGFTHVAHKAGDPPMVSVPIEEIVDRFGTLPPLEVPVRDAAGIRVIDAAAGEVEVELTPALRNLAGTLQGAMTALVAEAAAEDALSHRADAPVFVTDLDLRYLTRTGAGPIRTRTDVVGTGADAFAVVELIDASTDTVVTLVHVRGTVVP